MGVDDPVPAYLLDRAIALFATHVQQAIDRATDGKKGGAAEIAAQNALAPWIGAEQKFRDPTPGNF